MFNRYSLCLLGAMMGLILGLMGCSSPYSVKSASYHGYQGEVNHHSLVVGAQPEAVFSILADGRRFRQICPEWISVHRRNQGPLVPGVLIKTRVNQRIKLQWTSRVIAVEPNRLICQRFVDGIFSGGVEIWELEPQPRGTRVSHTIVVEPRGVLNRLIWNLKARRKHDWLVETFLKNLKDAAESNQTMAANCPE